MNFNSYIFILAYLPFCVISFRLIGKKGSSRRLKLWAALLSFGFLLYGDYRSALFLCASAAVNYCLARCIYSGKEPDAASNTASDIVSDTVPDKTGQGAQSQNINRQKLLLAIGVAADLLALGYTKYSGFLLSSLNEILHTDLHIRQVLVPIGISFLTFQQIMYLVDVYRGKIGEPDLTDYIFYITWFPKYVQGPITGYQKLMAGFSQDGREEQHQAAGIPLYPDADHTAHGLYLFILGLSRKVLIADSLSRAVQYGWSNIPELSSLELFIATICYTLQIYFDFSGYSMMAIGISRMLNIPLNVNFRAPYKALSINDFWKRWHVSLTGFFREYVYFPLGGNRKGTARTYINIMIIFALSGMWHGAAWTFLFWGVLHGAAQCLNRRFSGAWNRVPAAIRWVLTFGFVNLAWIFFRSADMKEAFGILRGIADLHSFAISEGFAECFALRELSLITSRSAAAAEFFAGIPAYGIPLLLGVSFVLIACIRDDTEEEFRPSAGKCVISILLLFLSVISLSGVVEFIYAGF